MSQDKKQFVMVRLPLTAEQESDFFLNQSWDIDLAGEGVPDGANAMIEAIGIPVPPCADVETVGWGRETSFVDIKSPGCHAVSIHKEWEGGIPLVRRTDMEAQVAKVTAEKDAEIARLRESAELAREIIKSGSPMKAAYVLETALKGPEA